MSCVMCHVSFVMCLMSPVICHLSPVKCHLSLATCHLSLSQQPQPQTLPLLTPPSRTVDWFAKTPKKIGNGRPILALHPSTRILQFTGKWIFRDATNRQQTHRRVLRIVNLIGLKADSSWNQIDLLLSKSLHSCPSSIKLWVCVSRLIRSLDHMSRSVPNIFWRHISRFGRKWTY